MGFLSPYEQTEGYTVGNSTEEGKKMSWLGNIFGAGIKEIGAGIDNVLGRFIESPEERNKAKLELENLLQRRDESIEETIRTELAAKERVLVAELKQEDNYTKRARPTVVYFGLVAIAINYMLTPIVSLIAQSISIALGQEVSLQPISVELPLEFWAAWGGIVSTWVIGRSAEKRGTRNRLVSSITGTPLVGSKLLME